MSSSNTFRLDPDCKIENGPPWSPPETLLRPINEIWSREKQLRGDRLTNGQVHTLLEFASDNLIICPSEYRFVLASRREPELREAGLGIRPVAVTGILLCADGLVLGRRGANVSDDAGLWEPAPAGGLSQPNPRGQVFEELEEELGLLGSDVTSAEICGLVEDIESSVFDIVFRLRTDLTAQNIRTAYATKGSDEYAELAIIGRSELDGFLRANSTFLLPVLIPMLGLAEVY